MNNPFALVGATLVTADEQGTVLPGRTLLVGGDGRIETVGPDADVKLTRDCRRVHVHGQFVMPGLINAHTHLFSDGRPLPGFLLKDSSDGLMSAFLRTPAGKTYAKALARQGALTEFRTGVTSMRTVGDAGYGAVSVRDAIERGDIVGPRMLVSGPLLAVSGGHGAPKIALVSDSPWDARRNVRINLRHGVNTIKIAATGGVTDAQQVGEAGRPQMTEQEMTAICEEAHAAGMIVAAHAQSAVGVTRALRAGVDTIEHGSTLSDEMVELFHHNPRSLRGWSALISTLVAGVPIARLDRQVTGVTEVVQTNARMILDESLAGLHRALEQQIPVGMGTDASCTFVTHYDSWRELDMLCRFGGMNRAQALHAATAVNAHILGLDQVTGTIEIGKDADLVVLDENPLENLRTLGSPAMVIGRGRLLNRPKVTRYPEIDAALDSI